MAHFVYRSGAVDKLLIIVTRICWPSLDILLTKGVVLCSCLHRTSMIIKHFIIQLMHNIKYVDTIKIIKYLKVLQHVSNHRESIVTEPCTVLS